MSRFKYFFVICICVVLSSPLSAQFAGGSGTAIDPYLISTVEHMQAMHTVDYTTITVYYYKMTADIDMNGVAWTPLNAVGTYNKHIHFDGNGHVIKNLSIIGVSDYCSIFGVVCGSVKNLGVINAYVEGSSKSGVGIIGGYLGLKSPSTTAFTGTIENCYTTGKVVGTDAVGGIVGNIGKPKDGVVSTVKNCYSTADVTATATGGNSRAGGIVGINFDGGVLEKCYATGTITAASSKAGGIVGWSDNNVIGCVSRNDSIINLVNGGIGRISAYMGGGNVTATAQGINCWGYDGTILNDNGSIITYYITDGAFSARGSAYDGLTKTLEYLSDPMNYFLELEWDFASDNNVWAQEMHNGYPIFQWLANRADYQQIDGLDFNTAVDVISADKWDEATARYFTLQGVEVVKPEKNNIYIVKSGNMTKKMLVTQE